MAPSKPNLNATSLFRVDGMVAVITGGGTGIGLTMARALARNGAERVYLLGRRLDVLRDAAAEHPKIFAPLQCDVTSHVSLQSATEKIAKESGHINLLIANSGVAGPAAFWNPVLSPADLRKVIFTQEHMDGMTSTLHVNVTGAFFTILAFIELLDAGNINAMKGGFGAPLSEDSNVPSIQSQVIVTSSIAAFSRMPMSSPAYAAGKAAILHLTKQASSNMARYGIRANALAPGLFPSELAQGLIGNRDPGKEAYEDSRFIPARRFGGDEEMAGTLLYLASRTGSYCNGMVLMADGGRSGVMLSSY